MNRIRLKYKYLRPLITSADYIKYINSYGVKCGTHTIFYDTKNVFVDTQRPWMLEIGDYCKITRGVIILQHDYSRSVLRRVYGEVIDGVKKTVIGDNVFIGMNSIILMGSKIGNNVIVGAGSIVSGIIPNDCVVAGNPAKVICSLEDYYKKRASCYVQEAKNCVKEFYHRYDRVPTVEEMGAFFPIYMPRDKKLLKKHNIYTKLGGDNEEEVIEAWLSSSSLYDSYESFLADCELNI